MRYIQVVFAHAMSEYGDIVLESGNVSLLWVAKKPVISIVCRHMKERR